MAGKARECRARVTAVRALTAEVLEADLAMVEPPALAFEAGQWISVPFGPRVVRAYSLASSPRTPATLTLCADVAPGGIGSRWFRALSPGTEVVFKGPLGGFVLEAGDRRRVLLVAEEIGIVPVRAIARELAAAGFARPATLVYVARDPGWLVHDADFQALARQHVAFAYHPGTGLAADAAVAAIERLVTQVGDLVAYVAGGAATIAAVRAALMARGMERRAVKWEKFW
jgi:ferredoxin-NADP reductase